MIRRSILSLFLLTATPAFADCQPFENAWNVSEAIAMRTGAELSTLSSQSTRAFINELRANGVTLPEDMTFGDSIVLHGKANVVLGLSVNNEVCFTLIVPTKVFDNFFGKA